MTAIIYTTWANVLIIAPALDTVGPPNLKDTAVQGLFLQDAANMFQQAKYGVLVEEIQRYCVAHKASLALLPQYGGGSLQNESIGGISISYVPVAPRSMKPWTETQYGRRVMQIIQQSVSSGFIAKPSRFLQI